MSVSSHNVLEAGAFRLLRDDDEWTEYVSDLERNHVVWARLLLCFLSFVLLVS